MNLESFQAVTVDTKSTARVGGGARLENIAISIVDQGK